MLIPYFLTEKLSQTLTLLSENGYALIASTTDHPQALSPADLKAELNKTEQQKIALIIGNEETGIRPHISRNATHHVQIPHTAAAMPSLNLSVAAGILLYALQENEKASESAQGNEETSESAQGNEETSESEPAGK